MAPRHRGRRGEAVEQLEWGQALRATAAGTRLRRGVDEALVVELAQPVQMMKPCGSRDARRRFLHRQKRPKEPGLQGPTTRLHCPHPVADEGQDLSDSESIVPLKRGGSDSR